MPPTSKPSIYDFSFEVTDESKLSECLVEASDTADAVVPHTDITDPPGEVQQPAPTTTPDREIGAIVLSQEAETPGIEKYQEFAEKMLGITFKNPELLVTAFTHRSYINVDRQKDIEHNERMEFLGDAVLELAVTQFLYGNYSDPEGMLTNWRSALVRTTSISKIAEKLGFAPMLRLSNGERQNMENERVRTRILANAYEAVIGAIQIDQGDKKAREFIDNTLLTTFSDILESESWIDPKTRYQEVAQHQTGYTPVYDVIDESGKDHEKLYKVGVYIDGVLCGEGVGNSKQDAQQAAAQDALERINGQADTAGTEKAVADSETEPSPAERQLPEEVVALATQSIDTLLEQTDKRFVSTGALMSIAFAGKQTPKQIRRDFIEALNRDPRIRHVADGDFQVLFDRNGVLLPELEEQEVSTQQISWLASEVISTLIEQEFQQTGQKRLLGAAKSMGTVLTNAELHEFYACIASDPRVIAQPDGSYVLTANGDNHNNDSETGVVTSPGVLSRAEKREEERLERRAERERVLDSGKKAKANPRIRGRNYRKKSGKRSQGRSHGKKKSIEQLIAEIDKRNGPSS